MGTGKEGSTWGPPWNFTLVIIIIVYKCNV